MRPEGSLPVVGSVRDHALPEGNLLNFARHIAQILRIAVDLGHPHKRAVVRPKTFLASGVVSGRPPRSRRQLAGPSGFNLDEGQSQQDS